MFVLSQVRPGMATLSYNDWGDRVVQSVEVAWGDTPITILHTHMTFPHANEHDPIMREQQVPYISIYIYTYTYKQTHAYG